MKNTIKIISIMLVVIMLFAVTTNVLGTDTGSLLGQLRDNPNATVDSPELMAKVANIMSIIRTVAIIAGVIALMIIGVKFIIGSAEEKAEYKKSMVPLIIGIVVVMAATQIITMIVGAL